MDFIVNNWETIIAVIGGICTIASAITAVTPTPTDDKIYAKIYKVIETLGLVVGKAKDKK